jgi:DNA-binding XRE family transcriptional regulator
MVLGLTTAEAGQYVHVTRKTWEQWEKLEAENLPVPKAKMELFFEKISKLGKTKDYGKLVVIFLTEESGFQLPIDVVAGSNYLGLDKLDNESAVIKSMAIDRITGRPYVHRTKFLWDGNEHVKDFCDDTVPQV